VGLVCHLAQQQQIISTEALTGCPLNAIFIEAAKSDVKASATFGVVLPDSGFDAAEPDLVYWFSFVLHKTPFRTIRSDHLVDASLNWCCPFQESLDFFYGNKKMAQRP